MSSLLFVIRNIYHRRSLSLLTIFSVMITIGLFVVILLSSDGIEDGARKGYGPFELVIGADGGETELVLNTFYRVGTPTGNIPYEVLESVQKEEEAEAVFGMTTGDNHRGYPIIGIDPAYFPTRYQDQQLHSGHLYEHTGEVTVGYYTAQALGLQVGDTFHGSHGLVDGHDAHEEEEHTEEEGHNEHEEEASGTEAEAHHDEHEEEASGTEAEAHHDEHHDEHESFIYKVVGILPKLNTPDDRAIYTTMDYAWKVHEGQSEKKDITSIMVKPRSLFGAQQIKQKFDQLDNVQAVYSSKAVADVLNMVDTGKQLVTIIMIFCVILAAVALLLSLTAAAQERKKDVGLLRLIGKTKGFILLQLMGEGVILTLIGGVGGLLLGHGAAALISDMIFTHTGIQLQPLQLASGEWLLLPAAVGLAAAASLVPAFRLYRVDPLTLFRA